MLMSTIILVSLLIVPLAGASLYFVAIDKKYLFRSMPFIACLQLICSVALLVIVYKSGEQFLFNKMLFADMLSVYELSIVAIVFFIASLYIPGYFRKEEQDGFSHQIRRFYGLWYLFSFTLTLVLLSNNMGLLWVAIEGTTLASAFLILIKGAPASLEAMWKYLLICSVGIAFGLIGTLLLSAASNHAHVSEGEASLLWTVLRSTAGSLDKDIVLAAFIFALIGFGTKAGLAPMHTWLPDVFSQAPSPVVAVFSAVMENTALYAIFRFLPIAEGAMGGAKAHLLLIIFGLLSVGTSMVFISSQKDVKRFLAYSSIEHMGIITTGVGLGGAGIAAALLHSFNHSIAKMLAFLSVGKIVQTYRSREIDKIQGAISGNRIWGIGFLFSTLALIGAAPFSIFISEVLILKAGFDKGQLIPFILLLTGTVVIFISAFRHIIKICFGTNHNPIRIISSFNDKLIVISLIVVLIVWGIWLPSWFLEIINRAAAIIGK
jgi:hydrogenase-4 component F